MLTDQRHQIIRAEIATTGRVAASDLAVKFGVSDDTIRRDLRNLAAQGHCRRVYGGAVAPYAGPMPLRRDHLSAEKDRLAACAVSLISTGQTLFLDAGSTNTAIARALPDHLNLTIATNSLDVGLALRSKPNVSLVMIGGRFDPNLDACVGRDALRTISGLAADVMFLGTCGLDDVNGVTAFDADEAEVKSAMVENSRRVAIAVTHDKLGTSASFRVAGPGQVDDVVVLAAHAEGASLGNARRHLA